MDGLGSLPSDLRASLPTTLPDGGSFGGVDAFCDSLPPPPALDAQQVRHDQAGAEAAGVGSFGLDETGVHDDSSENSAAATSLGTAEDTSNRAPAGRGRGRGSRAAGMLPRGGGMGVGMGMGGMGGMGGRGGGGMWAGDALGADLGDPHHGTDTTHTKVFVGGLAWQTTTETLRSHFEKFGPLVEAVVICDKSTGRSRGYGFVTYFDAKDASKAVRNKTPLIDGRRANCNLAAFGNVRRPGGYDGKGGGGKRGGGRGDELGGGGFGGGGMFGGGFGGQMGLFPMGGQMGMFGMGGGMGPMGGMGMPGAMSGMGMMGAGGGNPGMFPGMFPGVIFSGAGMGPGMGAGMAPGAGGAGMGFMGQMPGGMVGGGNMGGAMGGLAGMSQQGMSQQGMSQALTSGAAQGGLDMPLMAQMGDMSLINHALPTGVGGEEGGAESTADGVDLDKLQTQN